VVNGKVIYFRYDSKCVFIVPTSGKGDQETPLGEP
jgi:hypothetical protein